MKHYIFLLAFLITAASFAQGSLITAPETSEPDSLLIYTPQKRAAHIPFSDFKAKLNMPLIAVDEGNGIGYRLRDTDTSRVAPIGYNAFDYGRYADTLTDGGARGDYSVVYGFNNRASSHVDFVIGTQNTTTSDGGYNTIIGLDNKINGGVNGSWRNMLFGHYNTAKDFNNILFGNRNVADGGSNNAGGHFIAGRGNVLTGYYMNAIGTGLSGTGSYTTIIGKANVPFTDNQVGHGSINRRLLVVGNGTAGDYGIPITTSDALRVFQSGLITAPSLTEALIDADTTGYVLTTKPWVLSKITEGTSGAVSSVQGKTGVVVIDPDDLDDTSTAHKFVTATEKGLISTALQPSDMSLYVTKTFSNTANTHYVNFTNTDAGSGIRGVNSGSGSSFYSSLQSSTGKSYTHSTGFAGIGFYGEQNGSGTNFFSLSSANNGKGFVANSTGSASGNLFEGQNAGVLTFAINKTGDITANSIKTKTGTGTRFFLDNGTTMLLSDIPGGGGSDDQTAAEVPFTPYSTIAATNVQDAIEEVLDEIPTSLAAANITVSPSIGGNTDAYAVMDDHEDRIDALEANAVVITGTGTAINMSSRAQYNFSAASSASTFTMTNIAVGGYAEVLINKSGTAPTVTGATQLPNTAAFVQDTDMVLCIKDFNGTRKFWFVEF